MPATVAEKEPGHDSAPAIFGTFLKLGLTSFGGPVAHLGYFRNELVVRRKWIDEAGYGDLVALCQFLPGPASSQVGFALGVIRGGGLLGGLAAWAGFTLPSAILMFAFAIGAADVSGAVAGGLLHGLKLVAVAVVAQAVWGMARTLTPDRTRAGIAFTALAIVVLFGSAWSQLAAIVFGALAGLGLCRGVLSHVPGRLHVPVQRRAGLTALILFVAVLALPPLLAAATNSEALRVFDAFYRCGALVFGGGHVVLPLLQAEVVTPGWVSMGTFLSGYGVAQALPGPLFTVAAYLGAVLGPVPHGLEGALIALIALSLSGLLLVYGALPFWDRLRRLQTAQALMRGANAAVVGILGAALYNPVWTSAVLVPVDFASATGGFLLLTLWKIPPWAAVSLLAASGAIRAVL